MTGDLSAWLWFHQYDCGSVSLTLDLWLWMWIFQPDCGVVQSACGSNSILYQWVWAHPCLFILGCEIWQYNTFGDHLVSRALKSWKCIIPLPYPLNLYQVSHIIQRYSSSSPLVLLTLNFIKLPWPLIVLMPLNYPLPFSLCSSWPLGFSELAKFSPGLLDPPFVCTLVSFCFIIHRPVRWSWQCNVLPWIDHYSSLLPS